MTENGGLPRDDESVTRRFQWQETPPSMAVVEAVAETTEREPETLPPIFWAADPDALDALFERGTDSGEEVTVSMVYAGTRVRIDTDGSVEVWPIDDTDSSAR